MKTVITILLISTIAQAKPTKVLYTAKWCGPCKMAEKQNPDAVLVDVDKLTEKQKSEMIKKGVIGIPHIEIKK